MLQYIHRNKTLVWKTFTQRNYYLVIRSLSVKFRYGTSHISTCQFFLQRLWGISKRNIIFENNATFTSSAFRCSHLLKMKSIHLVLGNVFGDFQRCENNGSCSHETNITKLKNQWNLVLKLRKVTQHSIYITHVNRSTMHYRKSLTL